jgi:protein-L-isoaspartate(D-aspartate) O-methyltransferase
MAMITSQLRTSGVNTPMVLQRMAEVAREQFVPAEARGHAYIDRAIALADGGFLAAPVVQGMMLQEAAPTLQDRALLVDGGSGYLAELLRPLVASLDVVSAADAAKPGVTRDHTLLLVDGAAEALPPGLIERLADNARIITGLLENGVTRLAAGRKIGGHLSLIAVADIGIPVLPALQVPKGWSF